MEVRSDVFEAAPGTSLRIENGRGSVHVSGVAGETIGLRTTLHNPSALEYTAALEGDTVAVSVRVRRHAALFVLPWLTAHADVEVSCPPATRVDIAASTGSVHAEGLTAGGILRASAGSVHCSQLAGGWRLETSNGSVSATGIAGDLRVRTSNGSIEVDDLDGALSVSSSNGSLRAHRLRGAFTVTASNGRVDLDAAPPEGSDCLVRTSNGSIRLALAQLASLAVDVAASNGRAEVDLPGLGIHARGRTFSQTIGGGTTRLTVRTSNGSISIREAPLPARSLA
jgi:hypothetical protein